MLCVSECQGGCVLDFVLASKNEDCPVARNTAAVAAWL